MEEVLIDVGEHPRGRLEGVICGFEANILGAVLVRGVAGEYGRNIENNRSFLECQRVLRCRLVGKRIIPMTDRRLTGEAF